MLDFGFAASRCFFNSLEAGDGSHFSIGLAMSAYRQGLHRGS